MGSSTSLRNSHMASHAALNTACPYTHHRFLLYATTSHRHAPSKGILMFQNRGGRDEHPDRDLDVFRCSPPLVHRFGRSFLNLKTIFPHNGLDQQLLVLHPLLLLCLSTCLLLLLLLLRLLPLLFLNTAAPTTTLQHC